MLNVLFCTWYFLEGLSQPSSVAKKLHPGQSWAHMGPAKSPGSVPGNPLSVFVAKRANIGFAGDSRGV